MLDPKTKKILFIGIGVIVVLLIGIGIFFAVRSKGSSSDSDIATISGTAEGPGSIGKRSITPIHIAKGNISGNSIDTFILGEITPALALKPKLIKWKSASINGKSVSISEGAIDSAKTLSQFFGSIPDKIDIQVVYEHNCTDADTIACNVCNGEVLQCDPEKGWICVSGQKCPDIADVYSCCTGSNPVPVCGADNKILCQGCTGTLDCGPPGIKGVGPVCTATGWVCQEGVMCPTGPDAAALCKDGTFPTCVNNQIVCSKCQGTPPDCPASCNGQGLVCQSDGTWKCVPGTSCPTQSQLLSLGCCKDPDKPVPTCDSGKISCTTCSGDKPTSIPDCFGSGSICTATGWSEGMFVQCASGETADNCCKAPDTISQCEIDADGKQCTKCVCKPGYYPCGGEDQLCNGKTIPSPVLCCPESLGGQCSQVDGKWGCCKAEQNCFVNGASICCPANTMCKNNQCVPICGKNTDGSDKGCDPGDECVIIAGITDPVTKQTLINKGAFIDPSSGDAYICKPPSSCVMGGETSVPYSVDGYYPCFPLPQNETVNGLGYCSSESGALQTCFGSKTPDDCKGNAAGCTWIDILPYIGANGQKGVDRVMTDLGELDKQAKNGYYCDTSNNTTPFQRVLMFPGIQGSNCTYEDCFSRMAQPGITDVYYDTTTANCVALQSCNSTAGSGLSSKVSKGDGSVASNNDIQKLPTDDAFPPCGSSPVCPVGDNFICNKSSGSIARVSYGCSDQGGGRMECVLKEDGSGPYDNSLCNGECPCLPGFRRSKKNGFCYQNSWFHEGPYVPDPPGLPYKSYVTETPEQLAGCYNTRFQFMPGDGSTNAYRGNCDKTQLSGSVKNVCPTGWRALCTDPPAWGGDGCYCYCVNDANPIPQNYMYCDLDVAWKAPKGTSAWAQCTNPNGCQRHDIWGAGDEVDNCRNEVWNDHCWDP